MTTFFFFSLQVLRQSQPTAHNVRHSDFCHFHSRHFDLSTFWLRHCDCRHFDSAPLFHYLADPEKKQKKRQETTMMTMTTTAATTRRTIWHIIWKKICTHAKYVIPDGSATKVDVEICEGIFYTHQAIPLYLRPIQRRECRPITGNVGVGHVLRPVVAHPTHLSNDSRGLHYLGQSAATTTTITTITTITTRHVIRPVTAHLAHLTNNSNLLWHHYCCQSAPTTITKTAKTTTT